MSTPGKIYALIPKIMGEVGAISKDRKNTQQNYSFRGIDDVYLAVQGPLAKNGVFCTPEVLESVREERTSKTGGLLIYTILKIKFTFHADDGSSVSAVTVGEAMDSGDKSANKAMSAALKYAFFQLLCIPTEEDNDTEAHSPAPTPKAAAPKPPAVKSNALAVKAGALCSHCGTELVLSSSGAGYYCPKFNSGGEHTRMNSKDLAAYKVSHPECVINGAAAEPGSFGEFGV